MKTPAVYIMTNKPRGVLYIGVTSNLKQRVWQHRMRLCGGFTKSYNLERLVYYELHGTMEASIAREKRLKKWFRAWKVQLIEEVNPGWEDLWESI